MDDIYRFFFIIYILFTVAMDTVAYVSLPGSVETGRRLKELLYTGKSILSSQVLSDLTTLTKILKIRSLHLPPYIRSSILNPLFFWPICSWVKVQAIFHYRKVEKFIERSLGAGKH